MNITDRKLSHLLLLSCDHYCVLSAEQEHPKEMGISTVGLLLRQGGALSEITSLPGVFSLQEFVLGM